MIRRRRRGERGAAAVEFALIMPIFLMLLFGIIDFGYMINRASMINNAARDGARIGAFSNTTTAEVHAAANASLVGVPDAVVTVRCVLGGGTCNMVDKPVGGSARVTVTYQHKLLTPVGIFVPGGFDLSSTSEMRFEPR